MDIQVSPVRRADAVEGTLTDVFCTFFNLLDFIHQGVPKEKMQTYNCLEDQELREGIKEFS